MKTLPKFLLFAGFGLLPFWLALFGVVLDSFGPHVSAEYWNSAPWIIIFSVPFCVVTLVIAAVFRSALAKPSGRDPRK